MFKKDKLMVQNIKWDPTLYSQKHSFVFEYGEELIQLLNPQPEERVLDLGCGSGQLTQTISQSGAQVIGIDRSPEMIKEAKQNYPQLDFRLAEAITFKMEQQFDAIFSNAVLHWITEPCTTLERIHEHLKSGGRLVAEFGGKGNVNNILQALQTVFSQYDLPFHPFWCFPSLGKYSTLLESKGFRVIFASHFDRETELQDPQTGMHDWLTTFGSAFYQGIPESQKKEILSAIISRLKSTNFKDGKWYADYKRLRILAVKL